MVRPKITNGSRISSEINRSIARFATFLLWASEEITGAASTSGHCHLGDSIDTILPHVCGLQHSHDAESFGKLSAFCFGEDKRTCRTQTQVHRPLNTRARP